MGMGVHGSIDVGEFWCWWYGWNGGEHLPWLVVREQGTWLLNWIGRLDRKLVVSGHVCGFIELAGVGREQHGDALNGSECGLVESESRGQRFCAHLGCIQLFFFGAPILVEGGRRLEQILQRNTKSVP